MIRRSFAFLAEDVGDNLPPDLLHQRARFADEIRHRIVGREARRHRDEYDQLGREMSDRAIAANLHHIATFELRLRTAASRRARRRSGELFRPQSGMLRSFQVPVVRAMRVAKSSLARVNFIVSPL